MKLEPKEVPVKSTRSYRSPLREERARATRRRVVAEARGLFLERGYAATTLAAVAERAEVSPDSLYKTFGSKISLLREVLDDVIGGDDQQVPLLERPGPRALRAEPDQHRQVLLLAAGMTEQLERVRPLDDILRSAAAVDGAAAALRADIQLRQRRGAMQEVVRWIAAHGALRDGTSQEEAAAVVWTLTSPEVHHMLRVSWGWSRESFERWLGASLTSSLLPPRAES